MSLIFIHTWTREIDKKYKLPWEDDCAKAEMDPQHTCTWALNNFYKSTKIGRYNYVEPIPPYLIHEDAIINRSRYSKYYNSWQCTDISSVNDRIRIYN